MPRLAFLLFLSLLCGLSSSAALASDPCMRLGTPAADDVPGRIAAVACEEHRNWYRPFIEADGRVGVVSVREAQRARLVNGQPAWERVIEYWRGSGLLWQAGAGDCAYGELPAPSCRAFVVDTPWSAAFVSWVMQRAGLPGFGASASHLGYVRRAYREPFLSPYRVSNPESGKVGVGDMLCSVRGGTRVYGFGELAHVLSNNDPGLGMHCDIVVGTSIRDRVQYAHLIGGNVFDTVAMRELPLSAGGRFAALPMRLASDPDCTPESRHVCDLNRQDWSVLLQLRPAAELAGLRGGSGMVPAPGVAPTPGAAPASAPASAPIATPAPPAEE
ncbi:DUF2272 domain-containing protein [Luteimonas composti]|uniref:DUF2272 domain-containing protein n=1 Tax=Luteimonas composti TaxID=398257 RepID=A0ABT6MPY6_9GAMM|nr:DUF2272 domain-containing protein [Luteimonas composti]MDH7452685.1 DUF2272 domain-containing protein [Luteimonas composti]